MATPYFPDEIGEGDPHRHRVLISRKAYEQVRERTEQLGIETPSQFITMATSVMYWLTRELLNGSHLLIQRGDEITELTFRHPSRPNELLATSDAPPGAPSGRRSSVAGEPEKPD